MIVSTLLSLMWHVAIAVIFVIGIPFLERDISDAEPLVFVTIVDEVPETNQPAPSAKATVQSKEIEVASTTPPAPSGSSVPPPPTHVSMKKKAVLDLPDKKQEDILSFVDRLPPEKSQSEKAAIVLPETITQPNSQELPIAKPKAAPSKIEIASPIKRPEIPKVQKKPLSRPEVTPSKKIASKLPRLEPKVPKVVQPPKTTTRDLLKPLIDSKSVSKPTKQNSLVKESPSKNRDATMSGVLQNLAQASAATGQKSVTKAPDKNKNTLDAEEINSNLQGSLQVKPNQSIRLGTSEIDRLRAHISQCWSPPAAAPDAEKLEVDVRVRADSDGTVTSVESMDQARFKNDGFYRTAARAAVRAVEECSPLPLPAKKHEVWKDFIFHFDPKFISG